MDMMATAAMILIGPVTLILLFFFVRLVRGEIDSAKKFLGRFSPKRFDNFRGHDYDYDDLQGKLPFQMQETEWTMVAIIMWICLSCLLFVRIEPSGYWLPTRNESGMAVVDTDSLTREKVEVIHYDKETHELTYRIPGEEEVHVMPEAGDDYKRSYYEGEVTVLDYPRFFSDAAGYIIGRLVAMFER